MRRASCWWRSPCSGSAASSAATYVHYNLIRNPGLFELLRHQRDGLVQAAYLSRYGRSAGVPVAVGGVLFFAWVLLMVWGSRGKSRIEDSAPAYIFAGSTLALAVVLYLAYASFFILKEVCPLCVTTYVAVIGVFVISGGASSVPMSSLPRRAAARHPRAGRHPGRARSSRCSSSPARRGRDRVLPARASGRQAAQRRPPPLEPGSAQRVRALVGPAAERVERAVRERRRQGADRRSSPTSSARTAGRRTSPTSRSSPSTRRASEGREVSSSRFARSTRTATPACRSWCTPRPCDAAAAA